jgi:tRNA (cmo5U34)-methyltransferase
MCACYTMMFIPEHQRLTTLKAIRRSLAPRGALVLAEKVKRRDPATEQRCQSELFRFKRAQGLTEGEIRAKSHSIRHSLRPLFDDQNVALLHRAGFRSVHRIFSRACFDAWLASY